MSIDICKYIFRRKKHFLDRKEFDKINKNQSDFLNKQQKPKKKELKRLIMERKKEMFINDALNVSYGKEEGRKCFI